jgi:hypothetical protein
VILKVPEVPELPRQLRDVHVEPPVVFVPRRWEYREIVRLLPGERLLSEAELNDLGREGWELVGLHSTADSAHFYFKRQAK